MRQALERVVGVGWYVDSQEPITLATSEPEPDGVVVRGPSDDYADRHPGPRDVALVVEVSDDTLARDRTLKKRVYAEAGIPTYWILNLVEGKLEVYTAPTGAVSIADYAHRRDYARSTTRSRWFSMAVKSHDWPSPICCRRRWRQNAREPRESLGPPCGTARGRFVDTRREELPVGSPCPGRIASELPQHLCIAHPRYAPAATADTRHNCSRGSPLATDRLGAHRVQVDVPAHFEEVSLILDQVPLETPLEEVARAAMAPVEIGRVAPVEILHPGREVRLRGLDEDVLVVPHEHERVQSPTVRLHGAAQPVQPLLPVRVITNDRFSFVPSGHHVIQRPGKLDSQRSSHVAKISRSPPRVKPS